MMAALLRCLVLLLVSAPLHQYAEAVSQNSGSQQDEAQAGRAPTHSNRFGGAGSAFKAYAPGGAGGSSEAYPSSGAGSAFKPYPSIRAVKPKPSLTAGGAFKPKPSFRAGSAFKPSPSFRAGSAFKPYTPSGARSSSEAYSQLSAGSASEAYPPLRAGSSSEAYPTVGESSSAVAKSASDAGVPSLVFTARRTGTASRGPPTRRAPDEPNPFPCPDCPRSYANQRSLAEHKKSHETDETKCPYCHMVCSRKANLKLHIESAHPGAPLPPKGVMGRPPVFHENEPGAFFCGKCGKSYASSSGLRDHERCHETLDTYCFRCPKNLASKASYRAHMKRKHPVEALAEEEAEKRKYEEDNPVRCERCPKRFKNSSGLRLHQKYHDGETKCNECGMILPRPSCLSKHKKSAHSYPPKG